mmetsp:Transcript_34864/g.25207  ORF Transcript_34864/g.25207 Transcript_34864/m.25207 type:complete len:262 (-) Transcript_34864:169-954(-)
MVLSGSMMWIVIRSSSSRPKRLVFLSSKKEELPLRMSVRKPASILSESIVVSPSNLLRLVLAMSLRMRRRESSDWDAAVPTTMSALATSTRSVLARTPSQKMLMPPWTTGIEAVSVVFICCGSAPLLGWPVATSSMADTTRSTNTFSLSEELASGNQSIPRGMLKTTNWSGIDWGLTHMAAEGAHCCETALGGFGIRASKTDLRSKESSSYWLHAWKSPLVVWSLSWNASSMKVPWPTRTESSGMSPVSMGLYWSPSVNVT